MEKIKVFISNPQVLFREGIHFTLSGEEEFDVTGEAVENQEALTVIEANPPHVAILSMKSVKLEGPEATRQLRRNLPSVSVMLIVDSKSEDQLFLALKSGASACLTKDIDPDYLIDCIKEIAGGSMPIVEAMLVPGIAAKTIAEFEALTALGEHLHNLLAHLTPKELEVLKYAAAGSTSEQITAKLSITEDTLKHQLTLIAQKLVSNDQTRAMIEMVQKSLPALFAGIPATKAADYITKQEFLDFKDGLMQSLKSLIGELTVPNRQ